MPPDAILERLLRRLPAPLLHSVSLDVGPRPYFETRDLFSFWLRSKQADVFQQTIGYAIADENGFEAPMILEAPHQVYQTVFMNFGGLLRATAIFPRRSKQFFLRLYQLDEKGNRVRVGEFLIKNPVRTNYPSWTAQSPPIIESADDSWRSLPDLQFVLADAAVGVPAPGPVTPPSNLQAGEWSEFRFKVMDHGQTSPGWTINEIWISDATGNRVRVSALDESAFSNQFSRIENNEIVCVHRWVLWRDESAWKIRAHFQHETKQGWSAGFTVQPRFLNPPKPVSPE